jgi:hypothetical protein
VHLLSETGGSAGSGASRSSGLVTLRIVVVATRGVKRRGVELGVTKQHPRPSPGQALDDADAAVPVPDPNAQPARVVLRGEPLSAVHVPPGCCCSHPLSRCAAAMLDRPAGPDVLWRRPNGRVP